MDFRLLTKIFLVGCLCFAGLACSSAARYARGPLPMAALPDVRVQVTSVARTGAPHVPIADERLSGTVRSLSLDKDPVFGFSLWMADRRGVSMRVRVDTYLEGVRPDLPRGRLITFERSALHGDQVRIDDEAGSVAWFFSGTLVPELPAGLPFQVAVSPRRAYAEAFTADDLCRWTVFHHHLAVKPAGERLPILLAPGETRLVPLSSGTYLFAALDAHSPEESDCGQDRDSHVAWFWMRVPPEDARRLELRHPQFTTEPRGAGPAKPSPSPAPPPSG